MLANTNILWMSDEVIRQSLSAAYVLAYMDREADENGLVTISRAEIGRYMSTRTVSRALRLLERNGHIEVVSRPLGKLPTYKVLTRYTK